MKKMSLVLFIAIILSNLFSGCSSFGECERIHEEELILLTDITDQGLFERIQSDLASNFPVFLDRSGGDITACQSFTLHLSPIASDDRLDLTSQSIAVQRRGQSNQEEEKQKSYEPLFQMIQGEFRKYSEMTNDPEMTSESHIANTLLKAIMAVNMDAENSTILLYSDLVENSAFLNLYRGVPSEAQRSDLILRLLDPYTMQKFRDLRQQGLDPHIVVVLMPTHGSAVYQREVRDFWWQLFSEELGLQNVEFIDNLSQYRVE